MNKKDNRRAILKSAEELFLTRRFDKVTLDEISRNAKVGKGTIYLHFQDKEDLYSQVFVNGLEELETLLKEVVNANDDSEDKLIGIAKVLRKFYEKRRTLFRLGSFYEFKRIIKDKKPNAALGERHKAVLDIISNAISDGQAKGVYRDDIDPVVTTRLFMAMLREGYFGKSEKHGSPIPVESVINVLREGIFNHRVQ